MGRAWESLVQRELAGLEIKVSELLEAIERTVCQGLINTET